MLASSYFGITRSPDDDWFDPILDADTELFVDPFLVFKDRSERWCDAHQQIVDHFNQAFLLIAESQGSRKSTSYNKALALLLFPEPKELCLGYTACGTAGAGSGRGFAKVIAAAIEEAIERGLVHPTHFEELGILNEGIGSDRISDITCTVLKRRLIAYTQEIAVRHGLPLAEHELYASGFDGRRLRWQNDTVSLPTNPSTGGPLLLVPSRFLRDLPSLNAEDWWDHFENEALRQDVNYELMRHVDKHTIVDVARRHPDSVRRWTELMEGSPAEPYDLARDRKGVWQWQGAASSFASAHPLSALSACNDEEFLRFIDTLVDQFRLFVEEQGGWELLWDSIGGREKPEDAAQLLFRGLVREHCKAHNICIDREVNLGRGPVDFKFSNGYAQRALLEIKKLHNSKFWNGLERQLPSYLGSDDGRNGWFLAIRYNDSKKSKDRARLLPTRVAKLAEDSSLNIRYALVDARRKLSASKL